MTRAKNYGITDESLLKLFDLANFVSLEFHAAVVMEYTLVNKIKERNLRCVKPQQQGSESSC